MLLLFFITGACFWRPELGSGPRGQRAAEAGGGGGRGGFPARGDSTRRGASQVTVATPLPYTPKTKLTQEVATEKPFLGVFIKSLEGSDQAPWSPRRHLFLPRAAASMGRGLLPSGTVG